MEFWKLPEGAIFRWRGYKYRKVGGTAEPIDLPGNPEMMSPSDLVDYGTPSFDHLCRATDALLNELNGV
ncbi:MAG: hypothetical protein HYV32_00165 [Candidatus Kerfeldbacteria bacterium]|nr:hypothetical protein [Candidatus Kerfeldbacteria bacterium]